MTTVRAPDPEGRVSSNDPKPIHLGLVTISVWSWHLVTFAFSENSSGVGGKFTPFTLGVTSLPTSSE